MRMALAWLFYGLGHGVFLVFEGAWLPGIMVRGLYRLYHGLMTLSSDIQGDGRGPWVVK